MYKFMVVGDVHLNSSNPSSRIDDYPGATVRKIGELGRLAISEDIKDIIFLGDLWHRNQQSIIYLNKIIGLFNDLRGKGLELWSIVGNHELSFEKLEYLDRSPLQTMFASGVLKHLKRVSRGDVEIFGFDYPEEISKYEGDKFSVCVAHRFYEYAFSEFSLREKNIKELRYNLFLLGHEHLKYPPLKVGSSWIVRPGSLMRGTSHSYNISREPSVDIISIKGGDIDIKTNILGHHSAREIFEPRVFMKEEPLDIGDVSMQMDELISMMDRRGGTRSVYDIVDNTEMRGEVRALIEMYLTSNGIYREREEIVSGVNGTR